jgi:hypothetical protein
LSQTGVARLQPRERAEQAAGDADIRRFEPDVVVVERAGAVPLLALPVGEPADREHIRRVEQADAVRQIQTDAGCKLLFDVGEAGRLEAFSELVSWRVGELVSQGHRESRTRQITTSPNRQLRFHEMPKT